MNTTGTHTQLKPTLNAWHLWGLAVGLVISGEYFGWSYGWASAGTLGFFITAVVIAVMYTSFIFSFTELTTAIPNAGGPFAYANRAFGPTGGFIAGFATLVEFVFAPPAIAMAIGAYLQVQFPGVSAKAMAIGAYVIFMALNIVGVRTAATFELVVTLLAIFELLVFMGVVAPAFSIANFVANGWAGESTFSSAAIPGMFAAIPFAIWFFLAIEGVAMAAEEAKDPQRTIPRAYIGGIVTLVLLAIGVMVFAGGVGDWRQLSNINDPLPQAMKGVVGENSGWLHMLVWIGLFGLVASFHGIILGYSRQIFALGRAGYLPGYFAAVHPRFRTPHRAILAGGVIGIAAIFSDELFSFGGQTLTANIITMAVFGAIVMYIMSMLSLFALRKKEPTLARPFPAWGYPVVPAIALVLAGVCLVTMVWLNPLLAAVFVGFMVVCYLAFMVGGGKKRDAAAALAGERRLNLAGLPMAYRHSIGSASWAFADLKTVMAKATPLRSGDQLAGIAAESYAERIAARMCLAEVPLKRFIDEALIPYEDDEVTRLIVDTHDAAAFAPIAHLTVGAFRDWLLSDAATSEVLARIRAGITPEMAAAVSKLMRNQDLILVARKCRVLTRFRDTIGLPGRLAVRLQPNHPTDSPRGIAVSTLDGLLYGAGDAVIGINPVSDNITTLIELNKLLGEVIARFEIPTQSCILTHVTNTLQAIERGAPVDLVFQSIAGTQKANAGFGIDLAVLREARDAALSLKRATVGDPATANVMYFETGQGSALSADAHHGVDQQTCEARAYAVARAFDPLLVNTVVGFIGPEYLYDGKQIIRAGLEDHFCGKLLGLPLGCDVCYTNHAEADSDDMDTLMTLLATAGLSFIMGVPGADDVMLNYQSTSFHDALYLREVLGLKRAPEFEAWLEKMRIADGDGQLQAIAPTHRLIEQLRLPT